MIRHKKIMLTSVFLKKAVSHMSDNQWYIWWDKVGKFLGPGRVRNGPIALLKVNDSQKKQRYTKTKQTYFD